MITTWKISSMSRNSETGGVTDVYWQCVVHDEVHEECHAVQSGRLHCEPDPSEAEFVAYEDLTEDIVLGWVKAHLGADTVSAIEADRTAKVVAQVARKTEQAAGLPWEAADPVE
jgi:hypothetical protein